MLLFFFFLSWVKRGSRETIVAGAGGLAKGLVDGLGVGDGMGWDTLGGRGEKGGV